MSLFSLFQCGYIQSPRRKYFLNNPLSFAHNVVRLRREASGALRLRPLCFSSQLMEGPTAGAIGMSIWARNQRVCRAEGHTGGCARQEEQDFSEIIFT